MCLYCKAASAVLDAIWQDPTIRHYFHVQGVDLSDLGPLTHEVFAPAYLKMKSTLDSEGLSLLEAEVTEDLLSPYYERPGFRRIWDQWDEQTRDDFIREQSEVALAQLLLKLYAEDFADAYKAAYAEYRGRLAAPSA